MYSAEVAFYGPRPVFWKTGMIQELKREIKQWMAIYALADCGIFIKDLGLVD